MTAVEGPANAADAAEVKAVRQVAMVERMMVMEFEARETETIGLAAVAMQAEAELAEAELAAEANVLVGLEG